MLAVAALAVYVAGSVLFGFVTLKISYPLIVEMNLDKVIKALSMALAIAAITTRRRELSYGQIALLAITLALLLVSSAFTNDYLLVHTCVLMVAVGGIKLEKLCSTYSFVLLATITIVVMLSVFGLTYNIDAIPNSYLVFSYGFPHPNAFGAFLIACCASLAYSCWNRRSWWVPLVVSAVSAAFSYVFLSSRTATVVLAVLALAIAVGHKMGQRGTDLLPSKVFFASLTVLPFLMLLAMLVSTAFYSADNPVFVLFNKLINGRPYFAHQYYSTHGGFTLFGSKYTYMYSYRNGLPFDYVDSGFSRLALSTGVFAYIAMAATYLVAIRKLSRENPRLIIMVILLLCSAHLVVECHQLNLVTGVMAIFVSQAFAGKKSVPD